MRNFCFVLLAYMALILVSCDSREDYFEKYGEKPVILLHTPTDTTINDEKYLVVNIGWGEEISVYYDFQDQYGDVSDFEYEIICIGSSYIENEYYILEGKDPLEINPEHLSIVCDKNNNRFVIKENTTLDESTLEYHKSHRSYGYQSEIRMYLKVKNKIGKEGMANLFICIHGNERPEVKIEMVDIPDQPMAKQIVLTTIDEDVPLLYEYNIDGQVMNVGGYELENPSGVDTCIAIGKAAYNGTYITGTKLSTINHAFQYPGKHTIYARCKDKWNCWSYWTELKVNVNE